VIRGINRNIGVESANYMIKKVFEERFGSKKVVLVNTIRRTDDIQDIFRKRVVYK